MCPSNNLYCYPQGMLNHKKEEYLREKHGILIAKKWHSWLCVLAFKHLI